MGAIVLLVLPVLKFFYEAVVHQGLIGNFAMRTRWQAHRYVLRQSDGLLPRTTSPAASPPR